MRIAKNKVVSIEYTLKNGKGVVIDSSNGRDPLNYIHGAGNIIEGLEKALEGKKTGDELTVTIPPEDAYGRRDESLTQVIDRTILDVDGDLEPGMQFQVPTDDGLIIVTITAVEGEKITIDSNHPMAGETLNFQVKIVGVRNSTDEELSHGHSHRHGESCGS
ncbi:MAG: peptidylprolyl isomerase [Deltaproteobacteria bacterium]|nr:peptidylprolyl isomerase [Deltaproteobacteria bacterium]